MRFQFLLRIAEEAPTDRQNEAARLSQRFGIQEYLPRKVGKERTWILVGLKCILISMTEVTQILYQIEGGDSSAADQLLPLVYDELRKLAAARLAGEKPGQTLQATALVHEAYLRLVNVNQADQWNSRRHFFAAAAQAMRRILVDRAREKLAQKRGGKSVQEEFDPQQISEAAAPEEIMAVHDALDALAAEDPLCADLVKLQYFAGFSIEEAAEAMSISRATAYRIWTYARAWLRASLQEEERSE